MMSSGRLIKVIKKVTIPARLCTCEALLKNGNPCRYQWVSTAERIPSHCQNRECRSREWNGKKERKVVVKPSVILPKPNKVRGGNDDDF
jgi:hypothetical protein